MSAVEVSDSATRILAGLLEVRTGQQLSNSRRWRIETALNGLIRTRGIHSLDVLIARLVSGAEPDLATEVIEALLNNETYWFRDKGPFDVLRSDILPRLRRERARSRRISVWCAGCSTGQEAYSVAMIFAEEPEYWAGWTIDILGTDVSRRAIAQARAGEYSQFEVQRGLPVTQMVRHFEEGGAGWRLSAALKRMVRFQTHNLLDRAPAAGRFDIVFCRNVLLYLGPGRRRDAFRRLGEGSAPDAFLALGAGETVIGQTDRFMADRDVRGFYRPATARALERRTAVGA